MPEPRRSKLAEARMREARGEDTGFDVVCTIGHVDIGGGDHPSPVHAAFALIAGHDAEGTYSFPGPREGDTIHVTVEYARDHDPRNVGNGSNA